MKQRNLKSRLYRVVRMSPECLRLMTDSSRLDIDNNIYIIPWNRIFVMNHGK